MKRIEAKVLLARCPHCGEPMTLNIDFEKSTVSQFCVCPEYLRQERDYIDSFDVLPKT